MSILYALLLLQSGCKSKRFLASLQIYQDFISEYFIPIYLISYQSYSYNEFFF